MKLSDREMISATPERRIPKGSKRVAVGKCRATDGTDAPCRSCGSGTSISPSHLREGRPLRIVEGAFAPAPRLRAQLYPRRAFTLPEMLIAMAITLLLMAALAKSFGLIGESVRDGRAKVELTAVTRDVTLRINDELSRCTVPLSPPTTENNGAGYLVYFEGPLTDTTAAILGRGPSANNEQTFQDSKYGDLDDYLAFTAVAEEGNWFRGKVPRFVLDQKTAELRGDPYDPTNFPGNPSDPIMITSKYAEIIYFASPEYQLEEDETDDSKRVYVYNNDAERNPLPIDFEDNGLPDRVRLHRRVLLIRPDLNLSSGFIPSQTLDVNGQTVEYLAPDRWHSDNTGGIPSIKTPGTHGINQQQDTNAWLIGMAPVHQQCDLSLRRVMNAEGRPMNQVAANSLADLTKPENRFAHVRVPGGRFGGDDSHTSMPLLALGGNPRVLDPQTGVVPPPSGPVVTPSRMNGFLRPEFVLGQDHTHTDVLGDGWGLDRQGEDILATNVLGFDVQAFDPRVRSYIAQGADGNFGGTGVPGEGATESDDVLVTPNDIGVREVLATWGDPDRAIAGQRGGFVNLFYPFLAGGTIRGFGTRESDVHGSPATTVSLGNFRTQLDTAMSGLTNSYRLPDNAADPGLDTLYTRGLYKSGRVITDTDGNVVLIQPAYDTFTNHYERDGFLQTFPSRNGGANFGTVWYFNDTDGSPPNGFNLDPDTGSNGLDDGGLMGIDDILEEETRPPFDAPLSAVRVSVRLENTNTRQIQQMSAVREFVE